MPTVETIGYWAYIVVLVAETLLTIDPPPYLT